MPSSTLFDTAIGRCGLAWSADGVMAVALPEPSDEAMLDYLAGFAADLGVMSRDVVDGVAATDR